MYESEANNRTEDIGQIPKDVLKKFQELRPQVQSRTLLPWGEHCTECSWPSCYATCDLFSPRSDGKCRRFIDGMVRLDCPGALNSYLIKIRFKRWGKLWAPGSVRMLPLSEADRSEQRDLAIAASLHTTFLPRSVRNFGSIERYKWKKRAAVGQNKSGRHPNFFLVECYNPAEQSINASLTIRPATEHTGIAFQSLIRVPSGYCRELIPVSDISRVVDLNGGFHMDLTPNDIEEGATLIFGCLDFVEASLGVPAPKANPKVKCVVWDLDNTMWDGILVEDGADKLVLKNRIFEVIKTLDERGILHSIASKNDLSEAMGVLKKFGMDEYFLHPQVSWDRPKSEALKTIATRLSIGTDTLLFLDDSPFELEQVRASCPGVRVLPADRYLDLPDLDECRVPMTAEGTNRRKMYREESVRESAAQNFGADYLAFLRDCQIEVHLEELSAANLDRVHELTQRTNQMNFSGRRYERAILEQVSATAWLDTYVISCRDRFGSYGIVGFAIVDSRQPRMTDLMFSCRVQSKRVEHAVLSYLLQKYRKAGGGDFWADYRKTPRNAPSGRVFQDIGMEERDERDGVTSLVFPNSQTIPDDGIIRIVESGLGIATHVYSPAAR